MTDNKHNIDELLEYQLKLKEQMLVNAGYMHVDGLWSDHKNAKFSECEDVECRATRELLGWK